MFEANYNDIIYAFGRERMTTYMQKEYEAALELEERPVLNEVSNQVGINEATELIKIRFRGENMNIMNMLIPVYHHCIAGSKVL